MKSVLKKYRLLIFATILPIILLVIVWVVNGSQLEDAWLYLSSIGVILSSSAGGYSQIKKDEDK